MDEKQLTTAQQDPIYRQRAFWGIITLNLVLLLVFTYAVTATFQLGTSLVVYLAAVNFAFAILGQITSIILALRQKQDQAIKLTYYGLLGFAILVATFLKGRAPPVSVLLLMVSVIGVAWLLPATSRRRYVFLASLALILIWVIDWLDPTWRAEVGNIVAAGPIGGIAFGIIFGIILIWQGWSGNIRLKLVTSFTVVALLAVGLVGIGSYINFRRQIRADIRQRLLNIISVTALQQDGDLFATIQTPTDQTGAAYQQMQAVNHAILATDRDLAYIFSVRVDPQGTMNFVVDSGLEEGYIPVAVGKVYDDPSELLAQNALTLERPIVEEDFYTDQYGTFLSAYAPIYAKDGTRVGIVGVDIFADKVLEQEKAAVNQIVLIAGIALVVVIGIGLYLGNLYTKPVTNLSIVAHTIAAGDLSARAKIETTDEVGDLAEAFNTMTAKLESTLRGLEQRIAERTRNLQLAAEVGRSVSQVRALDVMLTDAAELIRKQFDLYYVQVYLVNPSQTLMTLQAGTGTAGAELLQRKHSLPLNTNSINGRAAIEKKSVVIANTADSSTFMPNPLLPETRSEIAVPLMIGDKVIGVLNMQSAYGGALSADILPAFETLAGQIAIAVQNANYLAEIEKARAEVEEQARRLVRANYTEYMDTFHQSKEIGYLTDENKTIPLTEEQQTSPAENALIAPISITGEEIGSLMVELKGKSPIARTDEFLTSVSRQVAQQIENLRLLDNAERYRTEAEEQTRQTKSALEQVEEQALQTQAALARAETQARLTQKISDAGLFFARSTNLQELVKTAAETMEIPEINRVVLEIFNYNSQNEITGVDVLANWWNGFGHGPTPVGTHYPIEILPLLSLFITPDPIFIKDAFYDARIDNVSMEVVKKLDIHAVAVLPLFSGDLQIGFLLMESEQTYQFKPDEMRLFSAMAPQISTVLESRRQFERAQQQAERESALNLISQKIQSATTVEAVLQIAARELGHALGTPMTVAQLSMKDKEQSH
jgi:GAF domain-containing protein/HAMP domain-containing protein